MRKFIQLNYVRKFEKGRERFEAKGTGEGNKWAKDHHLNVKKLQMAFSERKNIDRQLGFIIGDYVRSQKGGSNNNNLCFFSFKTSFVLLLFRDTEPKLHERVEDNVIQALLAGYGGNVVNKAGKRDYRTCFPKIKELAEPDRFSMFHQFKLKPTHCFYGAFIKIFGRKRFATFSKIPEKVAIQIKDDYPMLAEIIKNCALETKKTASAQIVVSKQQSKSKRRFKSKDRSKSQSKTRHSSSKGKGRGRKR